MVETKVARWWRARSGAAERAISVSSAGARRTSAARRRAEAGAGRRERGRRLGAAKAKPARQREERLRVARHELGAPLLDDLQLVLDVAQEAVGGGELRGERRLDVAGGRERGEGAERAPHAQTRVLATVHELLGLHEELDLTDAATPELHVARRPGRAERGVHPSLHRLQVLDRPEVEIA